MNINAILSAFLLFQFSFCFSAEQGPSTKEPETNSSASEASSSLPPQMSSVHTLQVPPGTGEGRATQRDSCEVVLIRKTTGPLFIVVQTQLQIISDALTKSIVAEANFHHGEATAEFCYESARTLLKRHFTHTETGTAHKNEEHCYLRATLYHSWSEDSRTSDKNKKRYRKKAWKWYNRAAENGHGKARELTNTVIARADIGLWDEKEGEIVSLRDKTYQQARELENLKGATSSGKNELKHQMGLNECQLILKERADGGDPHAKILFYRSLLNALNRDRLQTEAIRSYIYQRATHDTMDTPNSGDVNAQEIIYEAIYSGRLGFGELYTEDERLQLLLSATLGGYVQMRYTISSWANPVPTAGRDKIHRDDHLLGSTPQSPRNRSDSSSQILISSPPSSRGKSSSADTIAALDGTASLDKSKRKTPDLAGSGTPQPSSPRGKKGEDAEAASSPSGDTKSLPKLSLPLKLRRSFTHLLSKRSTEADTPSATQKIIEHLEKSSVKDEVALRFVIKAIYHGTLSYASRDEEYSRVMELFELAEKGVIPARKKLYRAILEGKGNFATVKDDLRFLLLQNLYRDGFQACVDSIKPLLLPSTPRATVSSPRSPSPLLRSTSREAAPASTNEIGTEPTAKPSLLLEISSNADLFAEKYYFLALGKGFPSLTKDHIISSFYASMTSNIHQVNVLTERSLFTCLNSAVYREYFKTHPSRIYTYTLFRTWTEMGSKQALDLYLDCLEHGYWGAPQSQETARNIRAQFQLFCAVRGALL